MPLAGRVCWYAGDDESLRGTAKGRLVTFDLGVACASLLQSSRSLYPTMKSSLLAIALAWYAGAGFGVAQTLRQEADHAQMLVGCAVNAAYMGETAYASAVAREFNMVEPEDAMKWEI